MRVRQRPKSWVTEVVGFDEGDVEEWVIAAEGRREFEFCCNAVHVHGLDGKGPKVRWAEFGWVGQVDVLCRQPNKLHSSKEFGVQWQLSWAAWVRCPWMKWLCAASTCKQMTSRKQDAFEGVRLVCVSNVSGEWG